MCFHELNKFTKAHAKILQQQAITEQQPGPILLDFNTLLDFIGADGVPVTGTHLLPLKILKPLNERLSRPVELGLKRPQQKSYPHLNGLYMLLRATGLVRVDSTAKKPRLILDEEILTLWANFNPTEQYLTLLETWAMRADADVIGEQTGGFFREFQLQTALSFFNRLPPQGQSLADNSNDTYNLRFYPGLHNLGLMELFGLLKVEHKPPVKGEGWQNGRIDRVPFGEAMLLLLGNHVKDNFDELVIGYDESSEVPFGILQPLLQPYFPEWQQNLSFLEPEFQEGVFVFKASLGRVWRRIAIPAELTLDFLGSGILNAYKFDHDHLDCFTYTNRFGKAKKIYHPYMEYPPPDTTEIKIGDLPLQPGDTMEYLFDFGDCWRFDVTLERIEPVDPALSEPKLLEQHGEAPEQYGYY